MILEQGHKVCVLKTDSPDSGRIGIVVRLSEWYGQPIATVLFEKAEWDENQIDHFYITDLIKI